ncbi:unnamed protein product [Pylaiella littoralis]
MIQYAARRACTTSLRQGKVCRWGVPRNAHIPCRSRSAGPFAVSDAWTNTNPTTITSKTVSIQEEQQQGEAAGATEHDETESVKYYCCNRTPTTLGRDVNRVVLSSQDFLHPAIVDTMVSARDSGVGPSARPPPPGGADTFATIARAYRGVNRRHLTLHLCEAFEESTGQPLVPSTPEGLVLLLEAMRPNTVRHAGRPGSGSKTREFGGERAVKELLRRYEEGGKAVPLSAYEAAVKALDGPDCSVALELAREVRSKLGDSTEGLGDLYGVVMRQCELRHAPDMVLAILKERREAGGSLAPDRDAYAMALASLGRARRVSEALDLFGEMLGAGEKPSAPAVNGVLAGCARDPKKFWRHAKLMVEGMEEKWSISPNVHHYTSLVTCLLKAGQWGEAIAMTDRMEGESITPNSRYLDHMMQASVAAKQWVTAEAIFRAMTEKYGHSTIVTRQSTFHFIQAMVKQKKLRKVISYVARAQDFPLTGRFPKGTMDTALLKWFRMIPGVTSEALAGVLVSMLDKGVRLHPDSYSVVISRANQQDGNKELSETLYNMLLAGNRAPSLSAANAVVKGSKTIEEALGIVASLRDHGLSPDKFTYAALLHCCSTAVDDDLQGQRATEVWQAMTDEGVVPHGGMLASYLLALMRSSDWKLALEVRERYRGGNEEFKLSHAERHVGKLDFVTRESAVVDGVMANGLVDNGQSKLALPYVLRVLKDREEEGISVGGSRRDESERFVDEDNHTVLAGIRACKEEGSCEIAMSLLAACEATWARGPRARDEERGGGGEGGQQGDHEWREMLVRTRLSRRRLYDCLVSVLDQRGQEFGDIRRVLESGMRNGTISLMKDQQGGTSADQAIDFHGWSTRSARCILRCLVEDLARGRDFLLEMEQYDLGRVVAAQGLREFGHVSDRWHVDSPDPRGRRREFADGVTPARFADREYGKGRKRPEKSRWEKPKGGWDGRGSDETQARWWEKEKRLSLIVGKPRPPPCIRNAVEEFCTLGVSPPLRIRKDASNPGILTIEPEDVVAWLGRDPRVWPA